MMFSSSTLALVAEALRALASDIDQSATGDSTVTAKADNGAAPSPLSSDGLAEIRKSALAIIDTALKGDPVGATELVKETLAKFGAARVSDLTAANANLALDALRTAFGAR
jgi:hypothetical protein